MFELPKQTILKIYAEFKVTVKGLIPLTHKSWFDSPREKKKIVEQKPLKVEVGDDERM